MDLLNATPALASAGLARRDEFFLAERLAQVYEGDTALHGTRHASGLSFSRPTSLAGQPGGGEDGGPTIVAQAEVRRHSLQVVVDTLFIDVDGVVPLDKEALPCHFGS